MTAPQHDIAPPASARIPDPGAGSRLREARMAAGLSVEEVAARLHLYPKTIAHIESDDYTHLPAPTFVRGYLRAYARLLELPPGPIVEAFDRHGLEPPALVADIANNSQARSGDFPVRIATYLIVLGLGALVVVWWQNQGADPLTPQLAEAPVTEEESSAMRANGLDVDAGATGKSALSKTPDATADGGDTAPVTGDPRSMAMPVSESVGGAASDAPAVRHAPAEPTEPPRIAEDAEEPAEPPEIAEPADDAAARMAAATAGAGEASVAGVDHAPEAASEATASVEATEAAMADTRRPADTRPSRAGAAQQRPGGAASAPAPVNTGAQPSGSSTETLRMHFTHDSWVEVYGGDGTRLYYDLARKGETVAVRGEGPFRVLLGYARGVHVEYNGVRFDHTPHIRGDIARFELGRDAGTRSNDSAGSAVARTPAFSTPGR